MTQQHPGRRGSIVALLIIALLAITLPSAALARSGATPVLKGGDKGGGDDTGGGVTCTGCHGDLAILRGVAVPTPSNLLDFVKSKVAAVQLGKALFWDQQIGGDGKVACASCHFSAGGDTRSRNQLNPGPDGMFNSTWADYSLSSGNFPVTTDDIVGSQGVALATFNHVVPGSPQDDCTAVNDMVFNTNGADVRRVTGRNAPSAINAVFNIRNFWDGRANSTFNGVSVKGETGTDFRIWKIVNNKATQVAIAIPSSSAASQAVGPPLSDTEMSCGGRTWADVGAKMLSLTPLGTQKVAADDSVFGVSASNPTSLVNIAGNGLTMSYATMIRAAFRDELTSNTMVKVGTTSRRQIEANFSLFFGLAIQTYESTLVSDQTRLDDFILGNASALTAQEQQGLLVFTGDGRCDKCHGGALLTESTKTGKSGFQGFFNTGVDATAVDLGAGPIANDKSLNGAFKTPGLRNVELNGPYFHDGSAATLMQVVDFYNRGGNVKNKELDSQIRPLGLTTAQKQALVAFMLSLTDERVRWQRAPFDHPALDLVAANGPYLSAVGQNGGSAFKAFLTP